MATLAAAECTGDEGVASLDPAEAADPPTAPALVQNALAVEAAMPTVADLPRYCRRHASAYFYTSSDWLRLAQRLVANASPCVDYWISIPPLAADKTAPRCLQDDLVRAVDPARVHVVAELHFAGWNAWRMKNGKTFADAGRQFVSTWRACGYLQPGERWALNEMHSGIRRNLAGARANMVEFLDAVREASGVKGIVWNIGVGQQTGKPRRVQGPDPAVAPGRGILVGNGTRRRRLGSGGVSRHALLGSRRHVAARSDDEPLAVPRAPVAARRTRPRNGRNGARFPGADIRALGCSPASRWRSSIGQSSAIRESYEYGGGSRVGACGEPGDHVWCTAAVGGATFNPLWQDFAGW